MVRGSASGRHSYCLRCWANQCERRPQPRSRHWRGSWVDSISARWTSPPRNSLSHWPRRTGSTPRTRCIWLPPYRPEPTVFLRTTVGTFRRTWPKSRSPTFRTCRTRGSRLTHSRTRPPRPARGLAATGFGSGSADRCAWSSLVNGYISQALANREREALADIVADLARELVQPAAEAYAWADAALAAEATPSA